MEIGGESICVNNTDKPAPPSFRVDDRAIGHLNVCGDIGERTTAVAFDMIEAFRDLRGLLVFFNSRGGNCVHADLLRAFLFRMNKKIPVIGIVKKAYSGGLTTAMACRLIFAEDDDSKFGCQGGLASFCDGNEPQIMVSAQAPRKLPARENMIGPTELVGYTANVLSRQQIILDERYTKDLETISAARGVPVDVLTFFLDGGHFTTQGAKFLDLVDG